MRKKTGFVAIVFSLLLVIISNQAAYAQEKAEDETSALSKQELKYKEMNSLIDKVIFQKVNNAVRFIKKIILIVWAFYLKLPIFLQRIIIILFIPACIGIITSHVKGIYNNRNRWQKHPYYELMYSYFTKSGTLQRKGCYSDAHSLLRDRKWSWVSFAGLAYRLGNYDNVSNLLKFVFSFAYIPMAIFGFFEMVLRIFFGTIWLIAFNLLQRFILFVTNLITLILIPVANIVDNIIRKTQYCPQCYETFILPEFICPSCGRTHKKLIPGSCGVLFARCACNKVFIPCTSFTLRSRLVAKCPSCSNELPAANPKHFSISLVGGNNSGKTAFLAAFTNLYEAFYKYKRILTIEGKPDNYFTELKDMFNSGKTSADSESRTYSIIHRFGQIKKDNLVLYDTLAKHVMSDSFPRSPKYLGFCDGIILMLDPLSVQSVKDDLSNENNTVMDYDLSDDSDKLVLQFIQQYNAICGFSTGLMSSIPVAVLINKADIEVVKREIGMEKIRALYDEDPSAYNNLNDARDQVCRTYLAKIGLMNMLNNIDAIFSIVSFFPVSAIGHMPEEGKVFTPSGVMEPIVWIAQKRHSRITRLLASVEKNLTNKG